MNRAGEPCFIAVPSQGTQNLCARALGFAACYQRDARMNVTAKKVGWSVKLLRRLGVVVKDVKNAT